MNAPDVPVIDLTQNDETFLVAAIAEACSTAGFFQVVNHGISSELIEQFRMQCRCYFTKLDPDVKEQHRRNETNARGYFDNELTKQRRDWKQALDVGVPGSRDWSVSDSDLSNACLDGFNHLPTEVQLPGFRETVVAYFQACADLSHRLALLMALGILQGTAKIDMVEDLRTNHTSYLRLNYYPACPRDAAVEDEKCEGAPPPPLGISPHRDAGFLTVLLQDDDCHSLQVRTTDKYDNNWNTVIPVPGALTINTGDMAQIWSNGKYKAPLHRVLTHPESTRYSAPFFYNPGYANYIQPVVESAAVVSVTNEAPPRYHPCLWGYFRAVRFAGDLTDLGVEIQVEDFESIPGDQRLCAEEEQQQSDGGPATTSHLRKQAIFAEKARFDTPFSVERFRDLLVER